MDMILVCLGWGFGVMGLLVCEGGRTKKWEEHTVVVPGIGVATCSIFVTSRNEYGTLGAQSRVGASRVRDE